MSSPQPNDRQQFWQDLSAAGLVQGDYPLATVGSPWYVKTLLGFSGWLAALFMLGFFALGLEDLLEKESACLVLGMLLLGGAFFLLQLEQRNEFVGHLGLAISLTGQGLVVWALARLIGENESATWLVIALFEVALALVMPDFIHRVFSSFAAGVCASVFVVMHRELYLQPVLLFAAVCALWLYEMKWPIQLSRWVPIAYGLTLVLLGSKTVLLVGVDLAYELNRDRMGVMWLQPPVGEALCALISLTVVWQLLRRQQLTWRQPVFIVAMLFSVVVCLLSQEARGLTIGLTLVLLGFAGSNRVLLGLGIIALLFFVSAYYYLLQLSLLDKAYILFTVGSALLLAYWVKRRWLDANANAGGNHA